MRRPALRLVPALILALAAAAHAQPRPVAISAVEHALGASPIHRVAGHGRLTVGIARDADLAVLTWPSPSCCDQLTHLANNALDARDRPRTNVREGFGAALGVALRRGTSPETVAWLHDPAAFEVVRAGYEDDTSLRPVGVYRHRATGLEITVRDAVHPDDDALQRRVQFALPTGSDVTAVALLAHTNLGPTLNVVPRVPLGDVLVDSRNDFAVLWDDSLGAFVHLRPATAAPVRDIFQVISPPALAGDHFGPVDALMQRDGDIAADVATLAGRLDTAFGPGVYAVIGSVPRASAFHAGMEDDDFCAELDALIANATSLVDAGITLAVDPTIARVFRCQDAVRGDRVPMARAWRRRPASAWRDLQDGTPSGSPLAAWRSDTGQRIPVTLNPMGQGEARVLIAFGATAAEARARYTAARDDGARADTANAAAWTARNAALRLPPTERFGADAPVVARAMRRALLHMHNGTDAATGMIVASIARQAPYGLDWPRDGAFFDYLLDATGGHAHTTRRLAWALPLARSAPVGPRDINALTDPAPPLDPRTGTRQYPEAAWEMNYYNTGAMGGFFRFEIDNTALMVWSAAVHVAFVPEGDRAALAAQYWPRVRPSLDLLAAWRDGRTGLQALANEDDNAEFTATLHGATTVFAALEAGARLARFTQHPDDAVRWERRASELRDAVLRRFYDPARERFVNDITGAAATNPGSSELGVTAWLVWPARMLPYTDPRMARQVRYDLEAILARLRGDPGTEGGAYLTKTTLSAAAFLAGGGDPTVGPLLDEALVRLARDVIDPDTQTMGEVFVTRRDADGGVIARENRVSTPHLWEAALFALSVVARADPAAFNLDLAGLPPAQTPPPGSVPFVPDPEPLDAGAATDAPVPGDAGMDAGRGAVTASGDGCGCRAGAPGGGAGAVWALAGAVGMLATRRRRRRG